MSKSYTSTPDIVSYGVGRQLGDQLNADPFEGINAEAVAAGVMDSLGGKSSSVSQEDMAKAFQEINEQMQAKQQEQAKVAAAEGEAFLADNAKKDGITVTDSGLSISDYDG